MKLRNKLAAITAAAMLAFTGVGFATWAFTKTVDAEVENISGQVTAAIEASNLSIEDGAGNAVSGLYIICDAPSGQTGLLAGEGIYWSTTNDATAKNHKVTSLTLIGSVTEDDNDILDFTTYDGNFKMTSVSAISGTWVNVAAASLDEIVTSGSKNADVQYVWTLPALSYARIPTSVTEVNALETEVNAIDLTYSFTFNVDAVNA